MKFKSNSGESDQKLLELWVTLESLSHMCQFLDMATEDHSNSEPSSKVMHVPGQQGLKLYSSDTSIQPPAGQGPCAKEGSKY